MAFARVENSQAHHDPPWKDALSLIRQGTYVERVRRLLVGTGVSPQILDDGYRISLLPLPRRPPRRAAAQIGALDLRHDRAASCGPFNSGRCVLPSSRQGFVAALRITNHS